MREKIREKILNILKTLELEEVDFSVEHPSDISHGDYATNVAMVLAKKEGSSPREIAERIMGALVASKEEEIEKIEIAGPGFINFYLSDKFFKASLDRILEESRDFGKNQTHKSHSVMVEFTDPNPFKVFHIGHLMSNAIGESISRLLEFSGASLVRANYQGDVGMHVAKAIWGMKQSAGNMPDELDGLSDKAEFLGRAYVLGAKKFEEDESAQEEIRDINKKLYDKSDKEINELYEKGRTWSLDHFEEIYEVLGTKFDEYFFESEVSDAGLKIVKENVGDVFEESDGAIVFKGEERDEQLHTRVFVNKEGLPTYEAKELGLVVEKQKRHKFDESVTITADEQREVFRVVKTAMEEIIPELGEKIRYVDHGMLVLPSGKMSSRKGEVITGEALLLEMIDLAFEKMDDERVSEKERSKIAKQVAVAAIKYSILKQKPGKNIVFDPEESISFEGSSGPYLQYTYARIHSILDKGHKEGFEPHILDTGELPETDLEKLLYRFPEVVIDATENYAPQTIATYATEIAQSFNSFYGGDKIVDKENKLVTEYKLALTQATGFVLQNALFLLGIESPDRM